MAEKFPLMTYVTGILARLNANSRKPTAYLYNGIRLPALPEWDREKYPYAVIYTRSLTENGSGLTLLSFVSTKLSFVDNTADALTIDETTEFLAKIYHLENGEWVIKTEDAMVNLYMYLGVTIWANYDVLNYADTTVHLSASDPIPIYE